MSTSPHLLAPVTVTLWGSDETQIFERVSDVKDWARLQQDAWADGVKPSFGHLVQQWDAQANYPGAIQKISTELGELLIEPETQRTEPVKQQIQQLHTQLNQRLDKYSNGQNLSTAHPHFAHIQAIAEADPNAGAVLMIACLSNGQRFLAQHDHSDAIARVGVASAYIDSARRRTIRSLKAELTDLRKRAESDISELRSGLDELQARSKEQAAQHQASVEERSQNWDELTKSCHGDWDELKRVYDEKLALLAPTEYWRDRSKAHKKSAIIYAVAFGFALLVLVGIFVYFGVGRLENPGTGSVVLAILPVLIPAFAGIWVLRILGRLLSENLKIAQDAHERETLVKTFLALMRDETTGKSVVTDDDRTLILHALFRQSTVTAVDDSPPLHWIESLRRKS